MVHPTFDSNQQSDKSTVIDKEGVNQEPDFPHGSAKFSSGLKPIETLSEARKAVRQGVFASLLIASITFAITMAFLLGTAPEELNSIANLTSFLDVGISLLIAWGIHKMSRLAAVSGLLIHLVSRIYIYQVTGAGVWDILIASAIAWCFINAIRGTFAYHRLKETT